MKQIFAIAINCLKELWRKKDIYTFLVLFFILFIFLISENFFGIRDISRYTKDIGFTIALLFSLIIAVTFSVKRIPSEVEFKTIYALLAKPLTRFQLIIGKFLGSFFTSSSAFSALFALFAIFVYIKGEGVAPILLAQSYILGLCLMSVLCSVSTLLSLFFTTSGAATLSFIIYFGITWFSDMLRNTLLDSGGITKILGLIFYYLIPHYEFYDIKIRLVHSWEPLPTTIFLLIIVYSLVYTYTLLFLSYLGIKRRVF